MKTICQITLYRKADGQFQCKIKDCETRQTVYHDDDNPMLAFAYAEKKLRGVVGFVINNDPADYEPDNWKGVGQ